MTFPSPTPGILARAINMLGENKSGIDCVPDGKREMRQNAMPKPKHTHDRAFRAWLNVEFLSSTEQV